MLLKPRMPWHHFIFASVIIINKHFFFHFHFKFDFVMIRNKYCHLCNQQILMQRELSYLRSVQETESEISVVCSNLEIPARFYYNSKRTANKSITWVMSRPVSAQKVSGHKVSKSDSMCQKVSSHKVSGH